MRTSRQSIASAARAAFTLAEVLAALALMAIVVPVVIEALHVATRSGELAQRRALAAHVGQRVLEEAVVTHQWSQTVQNGTEQVGAYQFRWTMRNDPWNQSGTTGTTPAASSTSSTANPNAIHQLSVEVSFLAQGRDQSVSLATLIDTSQ